MDVPQRAVGTRGIGWSTDYPFGEINLLTRLSEMTKVRVSRDDARNVNYWVVRLTDDQLFECPIVLGSDVGTAALSNAEVQRLRQYLLKGGFLWVDDFWGTLASEHWASQMARVLPEFPIVDVARPTRSDRPCSPSKTSSRCQASSRGADRAATREDGDRQPPRRFPRHRRFHGRIMVAMTHNTDIGDSMEREGDDPQYFAAFSPEGYALATNIVVYALTHRRAVTSQDRQMSVSHLLPHRSMAPLQC